VWGRFFQVRALQFKRKAIWQTGYKPHWGYMKIVVYTLVLIVGVLAGSYSCGDRPSEKYIPTKFEETKTENDETVGAGSSGDTLPEKTRIPVKKPEKKPDIDLDKKTEEHTVEEGIPEAEEIDFESELKIAISNKMNEDAAGESQLAQEIASDVEYFEKTSKIEEKAADVPYVYRPQKNSIKVSSTSSKTRLDDGNSSSEGLKFGVTYVIDPRLVMEGEVEMAKNLNTWKDYLRARAGVKKYFNYVAAEAGLRVDPALYGDEMKNYSSVFAGASGYYWMGNWKMEVFGRKSAPIGKVNSQAEAGLLILREGEDGHSIFVEASKNKIDFEVKENGERESKSNASSLLEMGMKFDF